MKCFDLYECGMKFERHLNSEAVDIASVGYDWKKFVILGNDRTVNFHAPYGVHYAIRLPTFCSSMVYQDYNCHLSVASSHNNEIYRVDLEEGRFVQPLVTGDIGNCMENSPTHRLLGVGCCDGSVRFYDGRNKNSVVKSFVKCHAFQEEVTSLAFSNNGIELVTGSSCGNLHVYDMRSSHPLHTINHSLGLPIHTTRFHDKLILSADSKIIKLYDTSTNSLVTNIETNASISHCLVAGDEHDPSGNSSGLLLCAGESPKIQSYFCPALGKAPQWCSYLDNITEELEEGTETTINTETIYQDYKFLTQTELEQLGITNLIGTSFLKGYMHGYFIDQSLYNRVKSMSTTDYNDYRKSVVKKKIQEKSASRISNITLDKVKINQSLQDKLLHKSQKKGDKTSSKLLKDDRFSSLFSNPDFEIDEECDDYKLRHPSAVDDKKRKVEMEEDDYDSDQDKLKSFQQVDEEYSSEEDDGFARARVRGENYNQVKQPKMYEAMDDISQEHALNIGLGNKQSMKDVYATKKMSLNDRMEREEESKKSSRMKVVKSRSGRKEVMYVPKEKSKRRRS